MPSAGSFTVNDRAATPVAHTFVPRVIGSGVALFVESASVPFGERKFTISSRQSSGKYRVRIKGEFPVLVTETVNGVNKPSVIRTAYADTTLTFDQLSSLQERKDAVGMHFNAFATSQTMLDAVITGLESLW